MALIDAFLMLDGIKGESTDKNHKDEIELHNFEWSIHNAGSMGTGGGGGVGKASFNSMSFTKRVDLATPKLFVAAATGAHIGKGKISIRKAGGDGGQQDYLVYDLEKIFVVGVTTTIMPEGGVVETLELMPTIVNWEYKKQSDSGSLSGQTAAKMNRATNEYKN